jgi:hypothetical protein
MSDIKASALRSKMKELLLTSEFRPDPFTGKGRYLARLSGETPWGPLNVFEWDDDESMAQRKVMARVEQIASRDRHRRGAKPKNYHACRYIRNVLLTPTRISSLNPTTVKGEALPTGRVTVSVISNLLH